MVHLLVVDDDPKFRQYLKAGLAGRGIECDCVPDGRAALALLKGESAPHYDLMLLDVMMPSVDGWKVLEELRADSNPIPTIFVSARDAVEERIKGLDLGADDYIIKPFELSELHARIQAVLRRREHIPEIIKGPLTISLTQRTVSSHGKLHELSAKEYDLLVALARADGRVLSRKSLLKSVWGIDFDPQTNLVDSFIARLRRRLHPEGARLIRTVRGKGYSLVDTPS